MPRVVNQPAGGRGTTRQMMATPHKQSSVKLALADDRTEKAARLQSRQALQEMQLNQMKAAASPMRKPHSRDREATSSPQTPRAAARRRAEGATNSPRLDSMGAAVTPMKRVPILANFEEWMKMATDNKINAANSWNFALIDYFHDMSLLKEGDGVNFQKASCTLDGCVKIYTSRVDSVATETGRLLSGLADSGEGRKKQKGDEEGEDGEDGDEEGEEGEDGVKKKGKKKANRSHEATLAPSFASLQLKKLELEFAVDPLFKKASADFDEGGAKGLLLNHLSIDSEGRIVFDSSDDAGDVALAGEITQTAEDAQEQKEDGEKALQEDETQQPANEQIDLDSLVVKFFPDLSILDHQDICPSMKGFSLGSSDLSIPILKAPDDWLSPAKAAAQSAPPLNLNLNLADQTGLFLDGTNAAAFDDDDDGLIGGFDAPDNVGFGEGGEAWAKDAALEPMLRIARAGDENENTGEDGQDVDGDGYGVSLHHGYREDAQHEQILSYFSNAMQNTKSKGGKNAAWMGGEYWRIEKIKKAGGAANGVEKPATTRQRKEKEPFEIDFSAPMDESLRDILEAPPATNASISLPRAQWRTRGRNLLEVEDEPLDPRMLLRLWLKPKARVGKGGGKGKWRMGGEATEGLFGQKEGVDAQLESGAGVGGEEEGVREGDYDANFFADDDQELPFDVPLPIDDDDEDEDGNGENGFMDAREMLSPPPSSDVLGTTPESQQQNQPHWPFASQQQGDMLPGSFGSQLVTQAGRRTRPEFVNYARTAKKVDIRRLKENMWVGLSGRLDVFDAPSPETNGPPTPAPTEPDVDVDMMDVDGEQAPEVEELQKEMQTLKFTDMIGDLKGRYGESEYKDISTSYCMIVLLHLANEKGLVLQGMSEEEGMGEILVRRDESVGAGYVGE